jgi:hypothetical protein
MIEPAARQLEAKLASRPDLKHLRVKHRGKAITLYSETSYGLDDHARLTSLGGTRWGLSFPRHTGRWERTPFVGTIDELLSILTDMLGWHLAPRG